MNYRFIIPLTIDINMMPFTNPTLLLSRTHSDRGLDVQGLVHSQRCRDLAEFLDVFFENDRGNIGEIWDIYQVYERFYSPPAR